MTERITSKKPITATEKASEGVPTYSDYSGYWALQPNEQDGAVEYAAVFGGKK